MRPEPKPEPGIEAATPAADGMTLEATPIPGPVLSTETGAALANSYGDAVREMEADEAQAFYEDMRLVALWGYTVAIDPDDPLPMEEVDVSVLQMASAKEGQWFDADFAAESQTSGAATDLPGGSLDDWIGYGASRLDGMSVGDIRREAGTLSRIAEGRWRGELTNQLERAKAMEGRFKAQIAALRVTTPDEEERAEKRKTCEISLSHFQKDREDLEASLEALDLKDYDAARWVGLSPKTDCWVF